MNEHLKFGLLIISIIITSFGCKKNSNDIVDTADFLLWTNPDSCITYIDEHRNSESNTTRKLQVLYQHALFKTYQPVNDTTLEKLADFFENNKDYRFAGEAKYLIGVNNIYSGNHYEATAALKEAEHLLKRAKNVRPELFGLLYFYLGSASERSRFFEIACEYYFQAIPYFIESNNALYISSTYQHLGKSSDIHDNSIAYMDSALHYAKQIDNPLYTKELEVIKITSLHLQDSISRKILHENIDYMCDTCHIYFYANILAKQYLVENDFQKVNHYLHLFANDTANDIWTREEFYSIQAEILHKQGKNDEAYDALKSLHERQTYDIESSALANTYIISQKYEAAKEQEMRLEETIKKQRAYVWIGVLCIVILLISGIGAAYAYHLRKRLEYNRSILRTKIHERLEVAKQLHQWASKNSFRIPEAINMLSPKQAASDTQNWKNFEDEFNLCYDNMLVRWKESYPELTDSDLQYMALRHMGFSNSDIVFLLGVSKQTIYNRSAQVKQHLQSKDVDEH